MVVLVWWSWPSRWARRCRCFSAASMRSARLLEDGVHKSSFAFDVGFTILRMPSGEIALQGTVLGGGVGVRQQIVAKPPMISPEAAVDRGQMQVVLTRLTTAEEIAAGGALLAAIDIAGAHQSVDDPLSRIFEAATSQNIEDRFRRDAGHGSAPSVLEDELDAVRGEERYEALDLGQVQLRPSGIIRHDTHSARFESERIARHAFPTFLTQRTPNGSTHLAVDSPARQGVDVRVLEHALGITGSCDCDHRAAQILRRRHVPRCESPQHRKERPHDRVKHATDSRLRAAPRTRLDVSGPEHVRIER